MNYLLRNGLSYLLALVMVANPTVLQQLSAWAQGPPKAVKSETSPAPSPEELQRQAEEMERRFQALEAARHEIPRESFDPRAIVAKLGHDPKELFAWVRDKTYWVPYRGALRGPTGVLMDQFGSSLDRALLLAQLLQLAGQEVRLAKADLTEEQVRQLWNQVRPIPKHLEPLVPPPSREAALKLVEKYAKQFQLDGVSLRKDMEKGWQDLSKMKEELGRRLEDQVPRIAQAVAGSAEKAADAGKFQALRDHWWVQWRDEGGWVDLDPLLPNALPNQVAGQSKAATIVSAKDGKFELDRKLCHEVQIRLVVEQWRAGKLKEQAVLQHTLRPFQIFQDRISLLHLPLGWPDDLDLFRNRDQERLKKTVLDRHEWLPILMVGGKPVTQSSFTDGGEVHREALRGFAGGMEKSVKGFDPFKAFPPPGKKPAPKEAGLLTAEWIDYEIRSPGKPVRTIRRQVFDLLGPAARAEKNLPEPAIGKDQRLERGLNLLGETEFLLLPCQLSPDFVEDLITTRRLANRKVWPELLRKGERATSKELRVLLVKFVPLPGHLHNLALIRCQWSNVASEVFLDNPNILTYHVRLHQDSKGRVVLERSLDIVENEVAIRPGSSTDAFQVRLRQGVLDTNIEALLLAGRGPVQNTAELFLPDNTAEKWLTFRDRREVDAQESQLPKDVRARIGQEVASGYVVIVPPKAVMREGSARYGWWRIDPKTGTTLGIGERGWGQGSSELSAGHLAVIAVVVVCVLGIIALNLPDIKDLWKEFNDALGRGVSQVGRGDR